MNNINAVKSGRWVSFSRNILFRSSEWSQSSWENFSSEKWRNVSWRIGVTNGGRNRTRTIDCKWATTPRKMEGKGDKRGALYRATGTGKPNEPKEPFAVKGQL
jgi:hypothetical protein